MAPARPLVVLFLLERSCLASALARRPVTACWLWVFAVRSSRGWAAIPRIVRVRRLPPSPAARWPPFPGVAPAVSAIPRTASIATVDTAHGARLRAPTEKGNRGRRGPRPPRADHDDGPAGRRAGRGDRRACGSVWSSAGRRRVYGPARIAAPAPSGPSPSRGEAALVSADRAAA